MSQDPDLIQISMEETLPPPRLNQAVFDVSVGETVDIPGEGEEYVEALDDVNAGIAFAAPEVKSLIERPERRESGGDAKDKAPSIAEWQDFMGRVVIRGLTNLWITLALGDIELTDAEYKAIRLSKEDLRDMSVPIAELANKSKLAKKHGRLIVSTGDSVEAVMSLFIWARRVNRIARRHRKPKAVKPVVVGTVVEGDFRNGSNGPNDGEEFRGNVGGWAGPSNLFNPGAG